ncbi:MAG: hypothetical protein RIB60_03675 [Phycisphaerales bacterium]
MTLAPQRPLTIGLSPYHLAGPSPAAVVSLLIADRVVTIVPTPPGEPDRARARRKAESIPRFVELVDRWRWSVPLWLDGVLRGDLDGDDPARGVHDVVRDIADRDDLTPLRPFLHRGRDADDRLWLDAIASDLLRGGPDPGLAVPVTAALDAFCARTGALAARCEPNSIAERAEVKLARRRARVAFPAFLGCTAERLLEARDLLEPQLRALRVAITTGAAEPACRAAADALAEAFESHADHLTRVVDDLDPRTRTAWVSVELSELPADAALRSSVHAAMAPEVGRLRRAPTAVLAPPAGSLDAAFIRVVGR